MRGSGRDRVMAVKTLMFEGGGHDFQVDQEFAYDELGSQFLVPPAPVVIGSSPS